MRENPLKGVGGKITGSFAFIKKQILKKRIVEFAFLIFMAVLAFWLWGLFVSDGLADRAIAFLKLYADENPVLAGGFFILLAVLSVMLGPFTSAPVVPVALLLWGNLLTLGLLMIGWMVGGVAAYFIGSWAGYPVVVKIMSREKVDTWQDLASRRINFYFALLFRLAMPAETGYVFGLARYNFGKFMLATFLVESLTGAILVWGGDALLAQDFMRFAALIAGGIIVFSVAAYLFWRKWRPTR